MTGAAAHASPRAPRIIGSAVLAGVVLTVGFVSLVAAHRLLIGSFEGRWVYGYGQPASALPFALFALVAAASAALLHLPDPVSRSGACLRVALWIAAATGLVAVLRIAAPAPLADIVTSDGANSFYSVTQQYGAGDVLRRYARVQAAAPLHVQSNMPGKLMMLYLLQQVSDRPDVLAWLLVVVSSLGAWFAYAITRDLFDDGRAAVTAAVLYLVVPGRLFFLPLMNTITPVVVLACAWLFVRWLRTGHTGVAAAFGVSLYALAFFEPLPLVIGLLFASLAFRSIASGATSWERFVMQSGVAVLAMVATSESVYAMTGFEIVATFRRIGQHAVAFNAAEVRPYAVWVRVNLLEFATSAGVCQLVVFGAAGAVALQNGARWRARLTRPLAALTLGLVATLAALDLIGINRGEVARLWIFLACLFQIPVAVACSAAGRLATTAVVGASLLQAAVGLAVVRFVVP